MRSHLIVHHGELELLGWAAMEREWERRWAAMEREWDGMGEEHAKEENTEEGKGGGSRMKGASLTYATFPIRHLPACQVHGYPFSREIE